MLQGNAMADVAEGLPTKAAKIRALDAAGYKRAEIARFLGIRYQHVRNVLIRGAPQNERPAVRAASGSEPTAIAGVDSRIKVKIGPGGRIVISGRFP